MAPPLRRRFAVVAAAALLDAGQALPDVPWYRTVLLDHKFDYNGQRRYHALVPDGYPRHAPYPAIVMFHGNGGDAASFTYETNVTQRARQAGYVLVYVDGSPATNSTMRSRSRSWNAGTCCDEALRSGVDDVAYAAEVLRTLPRSLAVDGARIFLAGVSNGASMVLRVGCELPSMVAGLAVVEGSLETRDGRSCGQACLPDPGDAGYLTCAWGQDAPGCGPREWGRELPRVYSCSAVRERQLPIALFFGRLDPMCNISGQVFIPTNSSGYFETYSPMSYVYEHFRKAYGCSEDNKVQTFKNGTAGNATECYSWTGCTNVTYCVSDAGHQWYGDVYDAAAVCTWQGYSTSECSFSSSLASYGPQTDSISTTGQIISFFDAIRREGSAGSPILL
jgi:poly(3-hydroxybutyrate) depolymerase